jgi:hypothetical protein
MTIEELEEQAHYKGSLILGEGPDDIFTDIVHYFNKDMKEIGYVWAEKHITVFATPREWGDEQLRRCKRELLKVQEKK